MMETQRGFTVAELIVVVIVMGILAGIVILSMDGWKQRTEASRVQSDLTSLASAMEDYRNTNDGYPLSLPTTFTASKGVAVAYTSGNTTKYCINGHSVADATIQYYIQSVGGAPTPQKGTCS